MSGHRIDTIAKALASITNRRQVLRGLLGGSVGAVVVARLPGKAAAQSTTAGVAEAINAYRQSKGLAPIPVSVELTRVAQAHVNDLATYHPEQGCNGSLHSWSTNGAWTGGCYDPNNQATWPLMWNKPKEIANYPSNGYEIAAWATPSITAEQAVTLWQSDAPHDDVMLNHGIWANLTWQALGGWAADGYACAWFGETPGTAPPAGAPAQPTAPPVVPSAQPPTQPANQSPTQPATQSPTQSTTQPTTAPPTQPPTQSATQAPGQSQAQTCPYGPNQCLPGYVWRVARPEDLVCVTPDVRTQTADDNAHAAERVDPNGAYGPNSCQQGYVWREAYTGDLVCVTPDVRAQARDDNAHAEERKDPACAGATPVSGTGATPVSATDTTTPQPKAVATNPEPGGDASGLNALDPIAQNALLSGKVPGVSVAIAKDGKLVFARAYGVADPTTGEALTTDHRFRIASVTKPITSAAIMGLIEQGRLNLSDPIFGAGALLGTDYGTQPYAPRVQAITLQHLLEHTAGGWTNDPPDPMFQQPDLGVGDLITWVLDNRPLDRDPGTNWAYSNFGYCLLGRVIERVTGQAYADYVQAAVLSRCGITDMEIAGNTLAERRNNEVVYDASNTPASLGKPYEIPVARMDSHGGWIATATDLLRFAVRVDRFPTVPDILADGTIAVMITPSTAKPIVNADKPGYAKGWDVNIFDNWWHDGKLAGTQSFLVRSHDGFCWAAIANGNGIDLESMGWNMIQNAGTWPPGDPL